MASTIYTLPGRAPTPSTKSEKLAQWLLTHRAQLGLAFGLLVLAGALSVAVVYNRRKLREGGILQLSAARYKASNGQIKEALQAIDDVLRSQRINAVGMQAFILKADLLIQEKKFTEAAQTYEEGQSQASLPMYKALMSIGLASVLVESQKYPEAVAQYDRFIRDFPDHYLVPRAYMELGRLHAAQKQWKEAQASFERLLILYPKSPWASEANATLSAVKTQIPAEMPAATGTK